MFSFQSSTNVSMSLLVSVTIGSSPLAPLAALVTAMRQRIEAALGTTAAAAAETAGEMLAVPALIDGLAG